MTELSYPWGGTVTGDASLAPYSDDEWSDMWRLFFTVDPATQGLLVYGNQLAVTGAASPLSMNTGAALVDGKVYYNTAALAIVVPTPAVANRYDRIVLRKDFAAQTVRATRVAGVEGGGIPALTQNDGVTWDIPLYTVYITTLGAITLTDNRYSANFSSSSYPKICQGRLTVTSGTAVTLGDVTAAATLYFTPYIGHHIALYNGSKWNVHVFSELSLTMVGLLATTVYDVFVYDNSGVMTLTTLAWATATTRATALVLQDGVYVLSGTENYRYVGTIYIETANQVDDSRNRRHVWNYYNRVVRGMYCRDTTNSWNYTTATWRQANNDTTIGQNRVSYVVGVAEDHVQARNVCVYSNTNAWSAAVGIGIDSTSSDSCSFMRGNLGGAAEYGYLMAELPALNTVIGYHYVQRLEISVAAGTGTFYGDNGLAYMNTGMHVWLPS